MAAEIDTLSALQRYEVELQQGPDRSRRALILAILERWQVDADLTPSSRSKARELLHRFTSSVSS